MPAANLVYTKKPLADTLRLMLQFNKLLLGAHSVAIEMAVFLLPSDLQLSSAEKYLSFFQPAVKRAKHTDRCCKHDYVSAPHCYFPMPLADSAHSCASYMQMSA